jgi:ribosomal protein S18 acetylase RimI-like enzyme
MTANVAIRAMAAEEIELCAGFMSSSEPWLTLGRTRNDALRLLADETRERYVALNGETLAGFIVLNMNGSLVGYIQTVCVAPERRGESIGTALVAFAEERIFRDHPNVFMCVSSFNIEARKLYARLGYQEIGEIKDFLVPGHSEFLLRKTRGSIGTYQRR